MNQLWYTSYIIRIAITSKKVPIGIELALCIFCLGGAWTLQGMIKIQLWHISRCGTEYFHGHQKRSYRNIIEQGSAF